MHPTDKAARIAGAGRQGATIGRPLGRAARHAMRRLVCAALVGPACLLLAAATAAQDSAEVDPVAPDGTPPPFYVLTWDEATFPNVQVEARIPVEHGTLRTHDFWNTFFEGPRGWSGFIEIQAAFDHAGKALAVRRGDANDWQLGDGYSGIASIRYAVDFSFAERRWPAGNEQVALVVDGALYSTGLPVFVYGAHPESIRIRVVTPPGWDVATAWPRIGEGLFLVPDLDRLTRNTLAVGRFHHEVWRAGSFELRLALLGDVAQSSRLVRDRLTGIFDFYVALYQPDESAQFMIAVMPGPDDGEAYFDSFASSTPDRPTRDNELVWAGSLAHEFGHYWNGKRFSTTFENRAERQWFSEGGTEYFATLALRAIGVLDEVTYREVLSHYLTVHLLFAKNPMFDGVTLRQAGASKWRYRPGVYDSGVAAAYCLDGLIREHSGRSRSLADLMRLMNRRFGDTGTPYVFDDLVAAASETAGADLSAFFAAHVSGDSALPVRECARRMGHTAIVDGYHVYLR